MPTTYDKAEVHARRSLVPQAEALEINLDALPVAVRDRFMKIFNAFVASETEEEREELRVSLSELLDPDGQINTKTQEIDEWGIDSAAVRDLERQKKSFATCAEKRMRELNLSQRDVAAQMDVTPSNISQILSGKYKPQPRTLKRLADALGCQVEDLWPDEESP